jgi:hypothetical protein
MEMEVGGARFGIGRESSRQSGRQISRRETVSLLEFAAHALAAIAQPQAPERAPLREVRLEGNFDVYLLVPDPAASEPIAAAEPRVSREDPLTLLVREALGVPRTRRVQRAKPLFRAFHERLSVGLAASVPLSALDPPPSRELAEALGAAGIDAVGMILRQPPEVLADDVGDGITAAALNDLILHAEAKVASVTAVTVESVQSVANEYSLISAVDFLGSEEGGRRLVETLAARLELPASTVETQISAALA